ALRRGARHDAVELLADPAGQQTRGRRLADRALHLLRAILLGRAFHGERAELVLAVRDRLPGERRADQTLGDEIRIAPVWSGRVRVLAHGEAEVSDDGLAWKARHVLATSEELDDRQREIGKAQRIGGPSLQEEGIERGRIRLPRQPLAELAREGDDALPALGRADDPAQDGGSLRFEEARDA